MIYLIVLNEVEDRTPIEAFTKKETAEEKLTTTYKDSRYRSYDIEEIKLDGI